MAQLARALTTRSETRADELDGMQRRVDDLRAAIGRDVRELEDRLRKALSPRLQIARHPFVAAAIALGGALVAARIVRSVLRRVRTPARSETRRRRAGKCSTSVYATGRGPGVREAHLKEASE